MLFYATHLCEWLFLGDVSILGRFVAARFSLVLLAEADRPEGPLFLLENEETRLIAIGKLIARNCFIFCRNKTSKLR